MNDDIKNLLSVISILASKGLCPATGGNFSIRQGSDKFLITESGKDKNNLQEKDFILCTLEDCKPQELNRKPSAEALLHALIYSEDKDAKVVLHTHSIAATILSRKYEEQGYISISGYEMQKCYSHCKSHLDTVLIPVFSNSQDMQELASQIRQNYFTKNTLDSKSIIWPGFLLAGHGLYCWGGSIADAQRHLEGIEFLLMCIMQ
jgi:methylthioribulose-1-phosphate dehydratase